MKKRVMILLAIVLIGLLWLAREATRPAARAAGTGRAGAAGAAEEPSPAPVVASPGPGKASADGPGTSPAPPGPDDLRCRVRLVDERTGEPLPHFRIAPLTDAPSSQVVASDANGELDLPLAPGATMRFDVVENLGEDSVRATAGAPAPIRASFTRAPGAPQPIELRLAAGPTYVLELALPAGCALADLLASLRSTDPRLAAEAARAGVREGPKPWVRFRPSAYEVRGGPPWRLDVTSSNRLWTGSALVDEREGVAKKVVRIELEARARLSGRVTETGGSPIARQSVRIEPEGATGDPLVAWTGADGRFVLPAVPPGKWIVIVAAEGRPEVRERVALAALESRELDVVLAPAPREEPARIEGTVESSTGTYRDAVYVALSRVGSGTSSGARVEWSDVDGRAVGRFVAEGLKPGRYRVSARVPGLLSVEPGSVEVVAGGDRPRFVVRDDDQVEMHFRVTSGGQAIDAFHVQLSLLSDGEPREIEAIGRQGLASFELVPGGARLAYAVRADGFQPSWGEVTADGTLSPERPWEVELVPGWGIEVRVADGQGHPLEGAHVFFDDVFGAGTGADGRARVVRDSVPSRVRIEYRDWKPRANSAISPGTGAFRSSLPVLHVVMAPAP